MILVTSAPRKLDWTKKNETQKLFTVCVPNIKGLSEKIQKICSHYYIRIIFTCSTTLRKYLCRVKPQIEYDIAKNYIYSIPCSCSRVYKGEICRPLNVRLEEHWKAICHGEIEKSRMADHIWKEKGNNLPLCDQAKIVVNEEHRKRWHLK